MRVPRVGDRGFASHLEDHKLLYVSLEILLLTTSRRSRTNCFERAARSARSSVKKKTKIKFSGHPTIPPPPDRIFWILPCIVNIQTLLLASSTVELYPRHQYVYFKSPTRSMWSIDGVWVAQRILKGLGILGQVWYLIVSNPDL